MLFQTRNLFQTATVFQRLQWCCLHWNEKMGGSFEALGCNLRNLGAREMVTFIQRLLGESAEGLITEWLISEHTQSLLSKQLLIHALLSGNQVLMLTIFLSDCCGFFCCCLFVVFSTLVSNSVGETQASQDKESRCFGGRSLKHFFTHLSGCSGMI